MHCCRWCAWDSNSGQQDCRRRRIHRAMAAPITVQFLQQVNVKKYQSSMWCWDSNLQPLGHKSPPITTRPGHFRRIGVRRAVGLSCSIYRKLPT